VAIVQNRSQKKGTRVVDSGPLQYGSFVLSHGDIDLALTGTINPNHLESNIRCLEDGPLSDEMLRNARDIFEERFGAG